MVGGLEDWRGLGVIENDRWRGMFLDDRRGVELLVS